ncbi:hypothetical protein V6N13_053528 [Hibiscus sabdariffa]
MASFNVFFVLSLHALLLVSSTATRSLHPLALPHQAVEDEVKTRSPLNKFASLPHYSTQLTKAASVLFVTVKNNESKEFSNAKEQVSIDTGRFNVFFVHSLHALILISSTATRSLHPLALPQQAVEDEVKRSPLNKFASLPHYSTKLIKAASVTSATVKDNESKEFSNGKNKSALVQEGR